MARVKYYDQASQKWKYADAALNMKGKDGYTPIKGKDYFTDEDKQELTEDIMGQGVLTYNKQSLTEKQKAQVRENIGIDHVSMDKGHIQNKNNPHGVTAAQVGAATQADINAAVKIAAPRNLLDNSDFRNPVNQRGQNSYAGKIIGIDRWQGGAGAALVTVVDEGLKISYNEANGGTGTQPLMQYVNLSEGDAGKTVTFAARIKGGDVRIYFKGASLSYVNASDWTVIVYTGVIPANTEGFYVGLQGKNKSETLCEWMALYEGEYTVETLPEYQPKGYENELLVCRQYDGNTYIGLRKFGQPRNLLDNSDFKSLIAQAGINAKHGEILYFADRWENYGTSFAYDKNTGIITFSSEGISVLKQTISSNVAGKTVTLAIKTNNITGRVCLSEIDAQSGHNDINIQNGITTHTFVCGDSTSVIVWSNTGGSICIDWIALYEGEYTIDTLPEYQPKGYGAELMECKRYFNQIPEWTQTGVGAVDYLGASANIVVAIGATMRINPSVSGGASNSYLRVNGNAIPCAEATFTAINKGAYLVLNVVVDGLTNYANHLAEFDVGDTPMLFSADL